MSLLDNRPKTPEQSFWEWFAANEDELFTFDPNDLLRTEELFDRLALELNKVNAHLSFEFGPPDAQREFVISASGIQDAFPAVTSLTKAAPALPRWKVIAFRPRREPMDIQMAGKRICAKEIQFTLLDNGQRAGILLFIPGYREDEVFFKQCGYLLLDESLGEYDVEMRLGLITMLPPEANTEGERYALRQLPALFDQLVSRLERRSASPS